MKLGLATVPPKMMAPQSETMTPERSASHPLRLPAKMPEKATRLCGLRPVREHSPGLEFPLVREPALRRTAPKRRRPVAWPRSLQGW